MLEEGIPRISHLLKSDIVAAWSELSTVKTTCSPASGAVPMTEISRISTPSSDPETVSLTQGKLSQRTLSWRGNIQQLPTEDLLSTIKRTNESNKNKLK